MAKQIWRSRGRPRGGVFSYKDRKILENLATIATVHKVESNELFDHIKKAWERGSSKCGDLSVECRKRNENSGTFLFTKGRKCPRNVVAQFPISTAILRGENQLESFMETILAQTSSIKNSVSVPSKIMDLKVGMKKVSIEAEVLDIPKPKIVYTKYGTMGYVSNALIGDETGSMKMSLWNQQISMVHKGDKIAVRNGQVFSFNGEKQLRVGGGGKLSVLEYASTL